MKLIACKEKVAKRAPYFRFPRQKQTVKRLKKTENYCALWSDLAQLHPPTDKPNRLNN